MAGLPLSPTLSFLHFTQFSHLSLSTFLSSKRKKEKKKKKKKKRKKGTAQEGFLHKFLFHFFLLICFMIILRYMSYLVFNLGLVGESSKGKEKKI